mmetsp:Transcript_19676/g.50013  ORF Transcript_19676/g.50013 Transcript_19676/m.50013 type:complete len:335 (-) Transcript_19676:343-1347(-)
MTLQNLSTISFSSPISGSKWSEEALAKVKAERSPHPDQYSQLAESLPGAICGVMAGGENPLGGGCCTGNGSSKPRGPYSPRGTLNLRSGASGALPAVGAPNALPSLPSGAPGPPGSLLKKSDASTISAASLEPTTASRAALSGTFLFLWPSVARILQCRLRQADHQGVVSGSVLTLSSSSAQRWQSHEAATEETHTSPISVSLTARPVTGVRSNAGAACVQLLAGSTIPPARGEKRPVPTEITSAIMRLYRRSKSDMHTAAWSLPGATSTSKTLCERMVPCRTRSQKTWCTSGEVLRIASSNTPASLLPSRDMTTERLGLAPESLGQSVARVQV